MNSPAHGDAVRLPAGGDGVRGRNFTMHWIASMVADMHRILGCGARTGWVRRGSCLLAASLVFSTPAYATAQCPQEFGAKDPLVNVIGWLVVAVGVAVGGWLFASLVKRTRGLRRLPRCAALAAGFVGMLALWIAGFALAFVYFFFRC
ncbi:hypothetical protein [Xanthomonas medicagonis]|uniref:hypothetical protein n=1 Tax=Xanthomonas medicagonis TaxID=3160841 RepID=UPI003513E908